MHDYYMNLAIEVAKKGKGKTHTNPLVGAIIVCNDEIIAEGAHLEYGKEHAERNAIASCLTPEKIFNSTLYVTLEPCSHYGKQPPCVQVIIESGIKEVVIAQLDPNALVAGKGIKRLEEAGIKVTSGVLTQQVKALNRFYNFFHEHSRPFISLKQAITLDGKIAVNESRTPITGKEVYDWVRLERGAYQAILVGSQTVIIDDPKLTTTAKLYQPPVRIVLDRRGRLFNHQNRVIFEDASAQVWLFTESKEEVTFPDHVKVFRQEKVTIESVVEELTRQGIQSVYVEGGSRVHDAFVESELWDEMITYLAPKVIGGNASNSISSTRESNHLIELTDVTYQQLGQDMRINGRKV